MAITLYIHIIIFLLEWLSQIIKVQKELIPRYHYNIKCCEFLLTENLKV